MPLYDPRRDERDACGIGFVADARGRSSRAMVDAGLEALCRVRHRGAVAADSLTGDGAGLLLPIPRALLSAELAEDVTDTERLGLAVLFSDPATPLPARSVVEQACAEEDIELLSWRPVPTEDGALGERAKRTAPLIEQAVIRRPIGSDAQEGERRAFRARRRAEQIARRERIRLYMPSFSFQTVVYKALCAADQLGHFYPDLTDGTFSAWFALFHQRYSTNTVPTWERAQPFRFLGHNGEINTIRGNVASMRAREGHLGGTDLAPEELLRPVIDTDGSDSAMLDEALELIVRGGRDLTHAISMLVPSAWEEVTALPADVRDFFHFHACLTEPWDGPAAVVMTDGLQLAAALDRNGLRPMRISVCEDGLVACASEVGAVTTRGHGRVLRRRLGPGQVFSVNPEEGGVAFDDDVKSALARRRPYGDWLAEHLDHKEYGSPAAAPDFDPTPLQIAAGYSKEEFTVVIRPMATEGQEPTSSMGDDTAQPPLASYGRSVFSFVKQRFAQVTNPPIDHLRERHVMSISTRLGPRGLLLQERPEAAALREYPSCLLFPDAVDDLLGDRGVLLDSTWPRSNESGALQSSLQALVESAVAAVRSGAPWLIVSDRFADASRVPIPVALAAGAVHHGLIAAGLRSHASLVVDSAEPRETHHVACLIANGADAVSPRLALLSIATLAARGRLGGDVSGDEAQRRFLRAIEDGLLKVMSKMGIATIDAYRGAQIIEAIGLAPDVIDTCFTGLASPLGGLGFDQLAADALERHDAAYGARSQLANHGFIKFKRGGEYHAFNPDVIDALHETLGIEDEKERELRAAHALQGAVKGNPQAYERFVALTERTDGQECEPRDLLDMVPAGPAVPLEEVEPAAEIARRFSTGAMSHGALSAEAHETISVAMNLIGGLANTGEGGEDPGRYRDERNSAIKQVASGRFGVTPEYLAYAGELQIKMAQGSKPGEGGQLPGTKVSEEIARLRHTVPGVSLISPPPHHDIYSIEDLAQLIFDLKQANREADVSVKLVASEGVGTVAAGVIKGLADVVHISGADGGTGASPLSSIKNAGMPWEIGLAETRDALTENGLRERARIRVDGGLKTGRDILIAALLGADEYSFGTAALVAEGCILVRTCHRNTCPVGIATQDPALRAKFAGTPQMVARYLMLVAEEVRLLLSALGLRTLDEAIGRTDLLRQRTTGNPRADSLDLSGLLKAPERDVPRRFMKRVDLQRPVSVLGDRLHDDALTGLIDGSLVELDYAIGNGDRAVGARLGTALAYRFGSRRPPGTLRAHFRGEAGQSFGAFIVEGVELVLTGEANDYVCKGMGGGRVVIRPPDNDAGEPYLAGNTVLYGATGGQLFVAGRVGERFAVRNSGGVAVVEGTGDHACEYMTAGAVVILGPTGINLGAGMSGGEAYVYDPDGELGRKLNTQLVAAYEPTAGQLESLKRVISLHADATGSARAIAILEDWTNEAPAFKRVAPVAEVARLEALFEGTAAAAI